MNNVSGLADKSRYFASLLNVARKFEYRWVYILHITYLEKN